MKSYKNIQELNEKWKNYGFQINNKGELVANHEGKEYKIGQANFSNEKGKKIDPKNIKDEEIKFN